MNAATSARVALLTCEYPPEIYGGAGVHVEYLVRALRKLVEISVHCFGAARDAPEVAGAYEPWSALAGSMQDLKALQTLSIDLLMAKGARGAKLVHSHTWYTNMAGHLAKLMYGIPHVMTSHSLEPLRPWKEKQLGGGYQVSSFCERVAAENADAIIAVSEGMRRDVLRAYPSVRPERVSVVYNGIDPEEYRRDSRTDVLQVHEIDATRPYVVFVGRITTQKGIVHLLEAARHLNPNVGLVLCAGQPDTDQIKEDVKKRVAELAGQRKGVTWIQEMLPRPELIQILSHARAFVCPSIYEPFGIVNLEAMACELPVVGSAVGGIPEIVEDGKTGFLVSFEPDGTAIGSPRDPAAFGIALAQRINDVVANPDLAARFGRAGRQRVLEKFSWTKIAEQTRDLYERLCPDP